MAEPTRLEAERVLRQAKTIGENVTWKQVSGGKTPRWRLEATVIVGNGLEALRLVGNYGKSRWGFTLLMRNVPIRRCDFAFIEHRNPDGTVIAQPHKHRWDDVHRDREAYVPDDINFSNVNQAFGDFLKECNITLVGQYQHLIAL